MPIGGPHIGARPAPGQEALPGVPPTSDTICLARHEGHPAPGRDALPGIPPTQHEGHDAGGPPSAPRSFCGGGTPAARSSYWGGVRSCGTGGDPAFFEERISLWSMDDRGGPGGDRGSGSLVEAGERRTDASEDAPCGEASIWRAGLGAAIEKHAVLFRRNGQQNVQLAKSFFLPRFFLTDRGMHHILYSSHNQTTR